MTDRHYVSYRMTRDGWVVPVSRFRRSLALRRVVRADLAAQEHEQLDQRHHADQHEQRDNLGVAPHTGSVPDPEDLDTLGQMLALGAQYIDDQDEPDEQPNIATMEAVLVELGRLVQFETGETEPVEPADQ